MQNRVWVGRPHLGSRLQREFLTTEKVPKGTLWPNLSTGRRGTPRTTRFDELSPLVRCGRIFHVELSEKADVAAAIVFSPPRKTASGPRRKVVPGSAVVPVLGSWVRRAPRTLLLGIINIVYSPGIITRSASPCSSVPAAHPDRSCRKPFPGMCQCYLIILRAGKRWLL